MDTMPIEIETGMMNEPAGLTSIGPLKLPGSSYLALVGAFPLCVVFGLFGILMEFHFMITFFLAVFPVAMVVVYLVVFVFGRPPHYASDFFDTVLRGGYTSCLVTASRHPLYSIDANIREFEELSGVRVNKRVS